MEKYNNKYRIPATRLINWDYGSSGLYFITICPHNKEHYFGTIVETQYFASSLPDEQQNITEEKTQNVIADGTQQNGIADGKTQNVITDGKTQNIASLRGTEMGSIASKYWQEIPQHFSFVQLDAYVIMPNHLHGILFLDRPEYDQWQPNKFGPESQNLASIIRGYKAAVKRHATVQQIDFAWQSRYFERVIRSERELQNVRQYIYHNPARWQTERNNPQNLLM